LSGTAWETAFYAIWAVYFVVLVGWVILQKRSPTATLAWILLLGWLPVIGLLAFYFFGPQRLKRFRSRRVRTRVALALQAEAAQSREQNTDIPPQAHQLVRLGLASSDAPLSTAHAVDLLVDGAQTFEAMFEAIRCARHHVHLESYIFDADRIGTTMRDLLIEKAREGVKVRVLVDALGSWSASRRFFEPLRAAGGQVGYFHSTKIGRRLRPVTNFRSHRKILVCDGHIAFTGGINVTDDGDERVNPRAYHDIHLRIAGGAARWLQMVFLEDWVYSREAENFPPEELNDLLPESRPGRYYLQILHSGPSDERESIHRAQVAALYAATKRAWLTTPYFVPTHEALMALTSAAMRGVDVRILVPRRSDSLIVSAAARSYFDELIRYGVRIWEYHDKMLHSKTLVIDDECSFVGTANFDPRSFWLNFEVCAVVYGAELAQQLAAQFEADLQDSTEVPANRRLPLHQRFLDAGARLFSPLL